MAQYLFLTFNYYCKTGNLTPLLQMQVLELKEVKQCPLLIFTPLYRKTKLLMTQVYLKSTAFMKLFYRGSAEVVGGKLTLFMPLSEILNIIRRDASIFLLVKDTEIGNEE